MNHIFTRFLQNGRSLHPMQRTGEIIHSGMASQPAGSPNAGIHSGPRAKATSLYHPPVLHIGQAAQIGATRNSGSHF